MSSHPSSCYIFQSGLCDELLHLHCCPEDNDGERPVVKMNEQEIWFTAGAFCINWKDYHNKNFWLSIQNDCIELSKQQLNVTQGHLHMVWCTQMHITAIYFAPHVMIIAENVMSIRNGAWVYFSKRTLTIVPEFRARLCHRAEWHGDALCFPQWHSILSMSMCSRDITKGSSSFLGSGSDSLGLHSSGNFYHLPILQHFPLKLDVRRGEH